MEKILEKLPLMVVAILMVVFGLIACFANTQSIVSILLAGTLSSMYAVRAGGLEILVEDMEKLFSGKTESLNSCVMIMDLALETIMIILTVVSIVGLINGQIEANFINIFLPSWVMFMIIASIILLIILFWKWYKDRDKQETEEEEYLEESEEF